MHRLRDLVLVIGAMKAGTSSVHRFLDLHPQIRMSRTKELDFFVAERNWRRGIRWYERSLPRGPGLKGESSVAYSKCTVHSGVPQRIRNTVERPRLIYVLRDPIDRMISHWVHNYADGRETRPLEVALTEVEDNGYLDASRYALQLEQYLRVFDERHILVTTVGALRSDPTSVMQRIFSFLGVSPTFRHPGFTQVLHASSRKRTLSPLGQRLRRMGGRPFRRNFGWLFERPFERPELDDRQRQVLAERLAPDVERLRSLTGRSFEHWSL